MERTYIDGETFNKAVFKEKQLVKGDYEDCSFTDCDLSNADLSGINFIECEFEGCNLSTVKLIETAFKGVKFKDCKLLGLSFDHCSEFMFSVNFSNCILIFPPSTR
jgi:uncharacterized protein YjbI with pentapeptide repeats